MSKLIKQPQLKTHKAFSILETLVSISIVAIIMIMLNGVVLNLTMISQRSLARSTVREELASMGALLVNDIRNADSIGTCIGSSCTIYGKQSGTWQLCSTSICKRDTNGQVITISIPDVRITGFTIQQGFSSNNNLTQSNFLITIVGSHANSNYNINNMLRQISASTRNYGVQ